MPKLTWCNPPNPVAALLRDYQRARKMTSRQIGEAIGKSPDNVRHQIGKAAGQWSAADLLAFCDALGVPVEEMADALRRAK